MTAAEPQPPKSAEEPSEGPSGAPADRPTEAVSEPPATGHPLIDQALAKVDRLDELPLPDQLDRLAGAHETLHQALQTRPDATSEPG